MRHTKFVALASIIALAVMACGGESDTSTTLAEPEASSTTVHVLETTTAPAPDTTQPAGNTTVAVQSSTTEGGTVSGENPEIDVIALAYSVVFDSATSFEEKAEYIDDPSGLEDTVATYQNTGNSVGGVTVEVDAVAVNGDEADVTYTLLFNGNPTYPDQAGTAILTAEGWKITRDMFCSVMASARSACPAD